MNFHVIFIPIQQEYIRHHKGTSSSFHPVLTEQTPNIHSVGSFYQQWTIGSATGVLVQSPTIRQGNK